MKNTFILSAAFLFFQLGNQEMLKAAPVADFTTQVNCNVVIFTDASTGTITGWIWDFGDGTPIGNNQNPFHTYTAPGNYDVTLIVEDAVGELDTVTKTVSIPSGPVVNISGATTACAGQNTYLNANGGTTYLWSTGATTSSILISHITTTTYTVTATNANGCTASASATVTVNPIPTFTQSSTDASCGVCDGTASLTFSGGTAPYTYTLGPPGGSWTNLCPGEYRFVIRDAVGCELVDTVRAFTANNFIATTTGTISCGNCTGSASVNASGGIPPYSYQWSSGLGNTATVTNVCSGSYTVSVADDSGCVAINSISISQQSTSLNATGMVVNISCFSECDGSIDLTATGGVVTPFGSGYSYSWSNGAATQDISGLCAGNYSVTVRDITACFVVRDFTIAEPPELVATISKQDPTCNASDGSASMVVSGGTAAYSFAWNTGDILPTLTNLPAGTYEASATDANGCTVSASVTLMDAGFNTSVSTTPSTCDNADGSATVTVNSGTPPYTYEWNTAPQQTTATAINLTAGNYIVVITDTTGCLDTLSVIITDLGAPAVTDTATSATCQSALNGSIDLSVSGNTPFTFSWNTGDTTEDLSGIAPGVYTVNVTDSAGCIAVHQAMVGINPITLTVASTLTTCLVNDGTATVNASGGTLPYSYAWSNGQTAQTADSLYAGWYSVTVTDAFGCQRHINVRVNNPANCYVTISGTVYHDADSNCVKDISETGIPNVMVDFTPGGSVFTNANGRYSLVVTAGSYDLTAIMTSHSSVICPPSGSYSVTLNTGGMVSDSNDFALHLDPLQDLRVSLFCGVARPGFNQYISFSVTNKGNLPATGSVAVTLDSRLIYAGGTTPGSVSGNIYTYDFTNLGVNSYAYFHINAVVPGNTSIGTALTNSITAEPLAGDNAPADNAATCSTTVTGSYDPNDKAVSPEGDIQQDDTLMYYTIRFQNTGTDTAFTVVIKDTLDSNLDYTTFRLGTASHEYIAHFEEDNILVFTFENILLPDSNVNETASHGHVTFYIEHDGTLPFGTTVSNRAAIYFDYNEPIITNTVTNTIQFPVANEFYQLPNNIRVYPNPAKDVLTVEASGEALRQIFITDLMGRRVYDSGMVDATQQLLRLGNFIEGIYLLIMQTSKEQTIQKLMIVR